MVLHQDDEEEKVLDAASEDEDRVAASVHKTVRKSVRKRAAAGAARTQEGDGEAEDGDADEAENDDGADPMGGDQPTGTRKARARANGVAASPGAGARSAKEHERKKRELITMGKAKGFLTYDEVNEHMPESILSSDQMDDWLSAFSGEGIAIVAEKAKLEVAEKAPVVSAAAEGDADEEEVLKAADDGADADRPVD